MGNIAYIRLLRLTGAGWTGSQDYLLDTDRRYDRMPLRGYVNQISF